MPDYPRHSLRIMRAACSDPLGAPNATVRVGGPLQTVPEHPEQTRTNLNKSEHRRTLRPDRNARQIAPKHPEKRIPNKPERPDECASLIAPGSPQNSATNGGPT